MITFRRACRWLQTTSLILLVMPASGNYMLRDYGFGGGGVGNASSANYGANGVVGEVGGQGSSGNYKVGGGLEYGQTADTPPAPTLTNTNNYYNKLFFQINVGSAPSDTKFALAISTDNFVTTKYVHTDNTIVSSLSLADYQTYIAWGGGSGGYLVGLNPTTTYYIKAKALQGKYSESGYGPVASAATVAPFLDFSIYTDLEASPPFTETFSSLPAGSVVNSRDKVWTGYATNGELGGNVYLSSSASGLHSTVANYTITSATADLSGANEGFGAQYVSITQTSGSTFQVDSPYNGSAQNVGIVDASARSLFYVTGPVTGGLGSFLLKAKSSATTPAASDYATTLTLVAAASF